MVLLPVAYTARRLNPTTFLLIHADAFSEHPFIYCKLYPTPPLLVLIDTGCGAASPALPTARYPDLLDFLENFPVPSNDHRPLNPPRTSKQCKADYLIISTHCHYDHISGIPSFASTVPVIASSYSPSFLSPRNLPENSLCKYVNLPTPHYTPTFAADHQRLTYDGADLGLTILHTPGHTPDSLAVYDEAERWLFTGDSFYRRRCVLPGDVEFFQPIVFPPQGNWNSYAESLEKLMEFVEAVEEKDGVGEGVVRIGCAHTTEDAKAGELLRGVKAFFGRVVAGEVPVLERVIRRGEEFALWEEGGEAEFSLLAPERLRDEFDGGSFASVKKSLVEEDASGRD